MEFEPLLDRCRPALTRVLYRYRIPTQDAEDLLQETFVILLSRWETIRSPEAWLVATLRNRCNLYWRKRRARIYDLVDDVVLEMLSCGLPPEQERCHLRHDLSHALEGLAPHHQRLLHLRYCLGCSSAEAGDRLGYSAGSVRKMTQRSLAHLERELARLDAGPTADEEAP